MRIVFASAVVVALLVLLCVVHTDATKHLIFAPFIWAGNMVKDATQGLVAFKLSIATKLLAMITGNRSFRASVQYDSRLEKFQQPPGSTGHYLHQLPEVVPKPHPVDVEHDVKIKWLPGVKMPHLHMPHLHLPHLQLPSLAKFQLPQLPLPDLSHLKFHKIPELPSAAGLLHVPKFASGYINGGFKIGNGGSVNSIDGRSFNFTREGPFGSAISFSGGIDNGTSPAVLAQELGKLASGNATRNFTATVPDLSEQLLSQANASNISPPQNMTKRSSSNSNLGSYFSFIQSNDEDECIAKMVCSMAARPNEYGRYGVKVLEFFEGMESLRSSPAYAYKEAVRRGQDGVSCSKQYDNCKVDPKHLAHIGSSEL